MPLLFFWLLGHCTSVPPLRAVDQDGDLFKDFYLPQTRVYGSPVHGLEIHFNSHWHVLAHFNELNARQQAAARKMRESDAEHGINGEMALFAFTRDNKLALRIIVEEFPIGLQEYSDAILDANFVELVSARNKSRSTTTIKGRPAINWQFSIQKMSGLRLLNIKNNEYQVQNGNFNFRITFVMASFLEPDLQPAMQQILQSIQFNAPQNSLQ